MKISNLFLLALVFGGIAFDCAHGSGSKRRAPVSKLKLRRKKTRRTHEASGFAPDTANERSSDDVDGDSGTRGTNNAASIAAVASNSAELLDNSAAIVSDDSFLSNLSEASSETIESPDNVDDSAVVEVVSDGSSPSNANDNDTSEASSETIESPDNVDDSAVVEVVSDSSGASDTEAPGKDGVDDFKLDETESPDPKQISSLGLSAERGESGYCRPDGRCGLRAFVLDILEIRRSLPSVRGLAPPDEADFADGTDEEVLDYLTELRRLAVDAYDAWLREPEQEVRLLAEIDAFDGEHDSYDDWLEDMRTNDSDLAFVPNARWTDDRVLIGLGRLFNVNVARYDMNTRTWIGVFGMPNVSDEVRLTYYNGAHFDLRMSERHADPSSLLWDEDQCPFGVVDGATDYLRESINSWESANGDNSHVNGLLSILPRHLATLESFLRRIIGMFPESLQRMVMESNYDPRHIPLARMEEIRAECESSTIPIDSTQIGGVYLRSWIESVGERRARYQRLIDETDNRNGQRSRVIRFMRRWLEMNQNMLADMVSSLFYGGETSKQPVDVRFDQEENPLARDGAQDQWEHCVTVGRPTVAFKVTNVEAGNKMMAWVLEAVLMILLSGSPALGVRLLTSDCTALNAVNCGMPCFMGVRAGGGSLKRVVKWFITEGKQLRDTLVSASIIPFMVATYAQVNLPAIIEYIAENFSVGPISYATLTVGMVHSYLGHRGGKTLTASKGKLPNGNSRQATEAGSVKSAKKTENCRKQNVQRRSKAGNDKYLVRVSENKSFAWCPRNDPDGIVPFRKGSKNGSKKKDEMDKKNKKDKKD